MCLVINIFPTYEIIVPTSFKKELILVTLLVIAPFIKDIDVMIHKILEYRSQDMPFF